ncbi:MAG: hypothetical protein AMXMBFR46_23270 [Acidimicrobiia bacterium]
MNEARLAAAQPVARWRAYAACAGMNPALFYDPHPASEDAAKQVCAACAVRVECDRDAVTVGEEFGVWGGRAAHERPSPLRRPRPTGQGPAAQVSDDELIDIFEDADPERPALDQLLEHHYLPTATAYAHLARAERLGVVEHRGRSLFPIRR